MGQILHKPFDVKAIKEGNYYRLYVTHPNFKGRIRKRIGDKSHSELENITFSIKHELNKHFINGEINKSNVDSFIDNYISLNIKGTASIFDYKIDFIEHKQARINNKTKKQLTKSTISSYRTALKYFEEYLLKKRISPHPSQINENVMNGYYSYIVGIHNYKVKLHGKLKAFLNYLETVKNLPIDPSYKLSVFTEEYDNQNPNDDDIALSEEDVQKLIDLKKKFENGHIQLEKSTNSNKIPSAVQEKQFRMKYENLVKCLDCFLFMISTGQYHADIMKSKLNFSTNEVNVHVSYRRAKNGSLCKAIPIQNDGVFIGKEIISHYNIKNGSNFPLNLSLTHFDKHLKRLSILAELDYKITNKMARKTFASILYFRKKLPIRYLQILLGHKNIKDTMHYLRIDDEDIASEILYQLQKNRHDAYA